MCACTESVGTGIDAVCVERGRPKSTITMSNHTQKHTLRDKLKKAVTFLTGGPGEKEKRNKKENGTGHFAVVGREKIVILTNHITKNNQNHDGAVLYS